MDEKAELDGGDWERVEGEAVLREGALRKLFRVAEWTEEAARAVRAAQRCSGLSIGQSCRRLGIKPWRLYRWWHLYRGQRSVATIEEEAEDAAMLCSPFVLLRVVPAALRCWVDTSLRVRTAAFSDLPTIPVAIGTVPSVRASNRQSGSSSVASD